MINPAILRSKIRSKFFAISAVATIGLLALSTACSQAPSISGVGVQSDDSQRISGSANVPVAEDFHFSGAIESMSASAVVVGGRTFSIDASTMLDSGLAVGAVARVEYVASADGSSLAVSVETDAPDSAQPGDLRGRAAESATEDVRGNADEVGDLRGRAAESATEDVQGKAGDVAATPATKVPEDLHVSGMIESMTASTVVIGGRTFKIAPSTMLDSSLAVGVMANVEFVMSPDGSILALSVETDAADDAQPDEAEVEVHKGGLQEDSGSHSGK